MPNVASSSVVLVALLASSCGFGSLGIGVAASRSNDTTTRTATQLAVVTPENGQAGRTTLRIGLAVDARETLRIESVEYSLRGAFDVFRAATPAIGHPAEVVAGTEVRGEDLARRGDPFVAFVWNSHFDLDGLQRAGAITRPVTARAMLRVVARNVNTGELLTAATDEFFLDQSLVATIGGGGVGDGASPATASMLGPVGIASDAGGNLYVADAGNHRVRRILTRGGDAIGIETVVGNGFQGALSGTFAATGTSMNEPVAAAPDDAGNVYIAEPLSATASQLRFFERGTGLVSNLLGGFGRISSLCVDADGALYVADETGNKVWLLDLAGVDPVLDPPSFSDVQSFGDFAAPSAVFVLDTATDTTVLVAERTAKRVLRRRDASPAVVVAGGGLAAPTIGVDARTVAIGDPAALAANASHVFVADRANDRVLCVDAATLLLANVITQVAVPGGTTRPLHRPAGLTFSNGVLYVVETGDVSVAGQDGHQVVAVRDAASPGSAAVQPFACGDAAKVVAPQIGGVSTQVNEVTVSQSPG